MTQRPPNPPISRRQFLRLLTALGGAAALAPLLDGCVPGDPTPLAPTEAPANATETPLAATSTRVQTATIGETKPATQTAMPTADGKTRVALVKTADRASGTRQALDLLGINPVAGKSVFLKANCNSADPAPGSTHPQVLAALVTALNEMGASHISLGDRSGMGDTRAVMAQIGVFQLASELGFDALVLDELEAEDWVRFEPEGSHWAQGFYFARPALEAGALVQTCCLKTHGYGGHFTLSLKNSVGLIARQVPGIRHNFMSELHSSSHQRLMIAEINAAYTPALIVLDGVEAFISGGPATGEKVAPQVMLAGTDRVAVDAVGVALLRYHGCKTEAAQGSIFALEQIARAVELGLGVDSPEKIELVTADTAGAAYAREISALLAQG